MSVVTSGRFWSVMWSTDAKMFSVLFVPRPVICLANGGVAVFRAVDVPGCLSPSLANRGSGAALGTQHAT